MTRPRGPEAGWTVLVTGASSGLGRSIALELAGEGCAVVLSGRNRERLDEVTRDCLRAGAPSAVAIEVDLATDDGVETLITQLLLVQLRVDALVNNAGSGWVGRWSQSSGAMDHRLIRLLIETPLALTRAFLPEWKKQGRGAVLNIASTGAFQPGAQTAVYYACKAFLMNWSVALAREERSWLVVTTLCPGALKTGFSASAGKRDVPGAPGPEAAAKQAVRGWKANRGLIVPGFLNKVTVVASRLLPPSWVAALVETVQLAVKKA